MVSVCVSELLVEMLKRVPQIIKIIALIKYITRLSINY